MFSRNVFSTAVLALGGLLLFSQQASAFNETVCSWNIDGQKGEKYADTMTLMQAGHFASIGNVHLSFEMDEEGNQNEQRYIIRALILDQHAIKTGVGQKNINLQSEHRRPTTRIDSDLYEEVQPVSVEPYMGSIVTLDKSVVLSDGKSLKISVKCENSYGD